MAISRRNRPRRETLKKTETRTDQKSETDAKAPPAPAREVVFTDWASI